MYFVYIHPDTAAFPYVAFLMWHQTFSFILAHYNTRNPLLCKAFII